MPPRDAWPPWKIAPPSAGRSGPAGVVDGSRAPLLTRGIEASRCSLRGSAPAPNHDNPYPGFFGIFWGDEFAFLVAASPIAINLAVLSGPPVVAHAALPLLMLVQAVLVVADRRRLERMSAGEVAPPALPWALFAPGYLFQRARALAQLRHAPVAWLLALLVMLLPFFMLMFDPRIPGAAPAPCDRPGLQVHGRALAPFGLAARFACSIRKDHARSGRARPSGGGCPISPAALPPVACPGLDGSINAILPALPEIRSVTMIAERSVLPGSTHPAPAG